MDRTGELINLGKPPAYVGVSGFDYARNPWDMLAYNGKVYMGFGNAANSGAAANAGSAPIISLSVADETFALEYTTSEEQVERFERIGNDIYVPGIDQESTTNGNFYRLRNNVWIRNSVFANTTHTYDICSYDGALFSAHGSRFSQTIYRSVDDGATWTGIIPTAQPGRAYNLFTFSGNLYCSGYRNSVSKYNGSTFVADSNQFLKGGESFIGTSTPPVVCRPVTMGTKLVYIIGLNVADHQWQPHCLNVATSPTNVTTVSLPTGVKVWDTKIFKGTLYLLTAKELAANSYRIGVYSSSDAVTFTEEFYFTSTTFARSFERVMDGRWFFGLGCLNTNVLTETGTILKLPN